MGGSGIIGPFEGGAKRPAGQSSPRVGKGVGGPAVCAGAAAGRRSAPRRLRRGPPGPVGIRHFVMPSCCRMKTAGGRLPGQETRGCGPSGQGSPPRGRFQTESFVLIGLLCRASRLSAGTVRGRRHLRHGTCSNAITVQRRCRPEEAGGRASDAATSARSLWAERPENSRCEPRSVIAVQNASTAD